MECLLTIGAFSAFLIAARSVLVMAAPAFLLFVIIGAFPDTWMQRASGD
jgi:hypothetical protein